MQNGDATVPSQDTVLKRKFRWTFEADFPFGKLEPCFGKVAARPTLQIEEEEIDFLGTKVLNPNKQAWEKLTVTLFDADQNTEVGKQLFPLLAEAFQLYDLSKYDVTKPAEPAEDKWGTCKLKLYDGCGCEMESWELGQSFISKINFGELDYSSTDDTTIDIELTYKTVRYIPSPTAAYTLPLSPNHHKSGSMTIGELGLNGNFVID
jgi:hypothetical protein